MTSSCEADLVGVYDMMPQMIWMQYCLQCQGFNVKTSILYQDNKIAILTEDNGIASSTKWTNHINVQQLFIKYKVESGELTAKHCSTYDILEDYFTKPFQGIKFREFGNRVMGFVQDANIREKLPIIIDSKAEIKLFLLDEAQRETTNWICRSVLN